MDNATKQFITVALDMFRRPAYRYGDQNQSSTRISVKQSRYLYILAKKAGLHFKTGERADRYFTEGLMVEVFDGWLFVTDTNSCAVHKDDGFRTLTAQTS